MYAVILEGGGQLKVSKDQVLIVDLIDGGEAPKGKTVTFSKVLAVGAADGKAAGKIGNPFVAGASVTAEVIEPLVQGDKIYIHKFRRRKGFKKKTGPRQTFTRVKITGIKG